ncbi:MAG: hypothetical protein N3E37_03415 [Candidatus Micrarchaeota archaeon]|nr:hypothetical protein [Candidatus Micrarchaeota archaeon]
MKMRYHVIIAIIAIYLLALNYSQCPVTYDVPNTIVLPSVSYKDEEVRPFVIEEVVDYGEPMQVSISLVNGNGKVKFSSNGRVKSDTVQSIVTAWELAASEVNKNETRKFCDLVVGLRSLGKSNPSYTISGPSGGLGFYILIKAELENKLIRRDTAVTGALTVKGLILPVGGYYYKARLLYPHVKYFMVPKLEIIDQLLLQKYFSTNLSDRVQIIEVENLSDAYGFFTNQKFLSPKTQIEVSYKKIKFDNISSFKYDNETLFYFVEVINIKLNETSIQIEKNFNDKKNDKLKAYLKQRLEDIKTMKDYGYLYTAGNELFLLDSDLIVLKFALDDGDIYDYRKLVNDAKHMCNVYNNVGENTLILKEHMNLLTGIYARYLWGIKKLEEIKDINEHTSKEELLVKVYDVAYAYNWCGYSLALFGNYLISKKPKEYVNITEIDQKLKQKLDSFLLEKKYSDLEAIKYYYYAHDAYNKKDYLGALFNLFFAKSLEDTANDLQTNQSLSEKLEYLKNYEYKGFWAKVYETQFRFLLANSDNTTALRLGNLAKSMTEMEEFMNSIDFKKIPYKDIQTQTNNNNNQRQLPFQTSEQSKKDINSSTNQSNVIVEKHIVPPSLSYVSRDFHEKEKMSSLFIGLIIGFSVSLLILLMYYIITSYSKALNTPYYYSQNKESYKIKQHKTQKTKDNST